MLLILNILLSKLLNVIFKSLTKGDASFKYNAALLLILIEEEGSASCLTLKFLVAPCDLALA